MQSKKYLVELIGTFFLVATIGMAVLAPGDAGTLAPLAIGAALTALVYAGGHVSGAHYNPAVTLAVWLRGKCPASDVIPYMVSQVLGAVAAAVVVGFLKGNSPAVAASPAVLPAMLAEFLYTFALCFVILNVATAQGTSGNSFYGLAIGLMVTGGAYSVGPISGGVFNPAVAIGITVMGLSKLANLWIFLVANFAAAVVASAVFQWINADKQPAAT